MPVVDSCGKMPSVTSKSRDNCAQISGLSGLRGLINAEKSWCGTANELLGPGEDAIDQLQRFNDCRPMAGNEASVQGHTALKMHWDAEF